MTQRQAARPPEPTTRTRSRRANGEGSTPRLRPDGRYEVRIRWTDALGATARRSVYGATAKECRTKATALRREVAAGRPARDAKDTLAAYATQWATSTLAASDRAASTKQLYRGFVAKHIAGTTLGALPLSKVTARSIETWLAERRELGLADSSIRTAFGVLRAVLGTAQRDSEIGSNPALVIKQPRIHDQGEAKFLTPGEVSELLSVARNGVRVVRPHFKEPVLAGQTRYAPLFELMVNTGLRRGEALALRWADVDLGAGELRVRHTLSWVDGQLRVGPPKTRSSRRTVPLSVGAVRVFRELKSRQRAERLAAGPIWQGSEYVFTNEDGGLCHPRVALRALQAAAVHTSRPDIGLHTLRHSTASTLMAHKVPTSAIAEILGHKDKSLTAKIYEHVSPSVRQSAMDTMSEVLG